jgi:hypothetical protein
VQLEYELRTEIEFWQSAIEERRSGASEESLERMISARSLAERKLELLLEEGGATVN